MNLHEKLVELRKEVEYAQQDTKGFNYDYVSGTALLSRLRPKMDALGLLLIPSTHEYSWVETTKPNKNGELRPLFIVTFNMVMTWIDAANPEDIIEVPFVAFGAQDDISKAFGSALTYSERYFLLKFNNIPTDKLDPDAFQEKQENKKETKQGKKSSPPPDKPIDKRAIATKDEIKKALNVGKQCGFSVEEMQGICVQLFNKDDSKKLTVGDCEQLESYFDDNMKTPENDSSVGVSGPQVQRIWATAKDKGWDSEDIHFAAEKMFGKKSLTTLTTSEASQLIDAIEENRKIA